MAELRFWGAQYEDVRYWDEETLPNNIWPTSDTPEYSNTWPPGSKTTVKLIPWNFIKTVATKSKINKWTNESQLTGKVDASLAGITVVLPKIISGRLSLVLSNFAQSNWDWDGIK